MSTTSGSSTDTGPIVIVINAVLAVISTVVVGFRFWARYLTGAGWRLDDYLALGSLVSAYGLFGASVHAVNHGGLGREMLAVMAEDPYAITVLLKVLYIAEYIYGTASPLVKLCVLAFYRRIFPTQIVKRGVYAIGSLCIAWFLAIIITNIVQCQPISSFWNPIGTYKCIDLILYFAGNSVANCVIDLLTLCLPIREVMRLHVSQSKRAGLCGVFLLGGIVVVASLVRTISLAVLYSTGVTDVTQQYVTMWTATCVEIYVAIIGACLPTLVPAYRQMRYGRPEGSSALSRTYGNQTPLRGSNALNSRAKVTARSNVLEQGDGDFELLHGAQHDFYSVSEVTVNVDGHSAKGRNLV